ncbi:MAG TPA: hypothetical protein VFQ53_00995 [Kofleriaceae bacterium]|nr:hypothetical protein [Kofleriaceae bacterium]
MGPVTIALLLAIPSGVCLAITAIRWRYHLRRGERDDATAAVSGIVLAEDHEPVVELVLQLRIPHSRSGMSVEEKRRDLHARSFVIKTDAGELVDVEPPADVKLHASLGRAHKLEPSRFTKTARVRPGERVFLLGAIEAASSPEGGPFREGERPHPRIAPAVISTEPIGATARRAAANDRKWLVRWGVMTVLGPLPYAIPLLPLFVFAFWIREMIVAGIWWEMKRYSEYYGNGTTREDRAEYLE